MTDVPIHYSAAVRKRYEELRRRANATWANSMEHGHQAIANESDFWPRSAMHTDHDPDAESCAIRAAYEQALRDYPAAVRAAAAAGEHLPEPPDTYGPTVNRCPNWEAARDAAHAAWHAQHAATVAEWEAYRQAVAQGVAVPPPAEEEEA